MYRKVILPAYASVFRRITSVPRSTSCSSIQKIRYCHNFSQPTLKWPPPTESEAEVKLSFSDLDPDEFGTLTKEPENINEVLETLPKEAEDVEEFVIRDKEGKKQRRPMKFYYHLIKDLLNEKKIVDAIDVLEVRMKQDAIKPDYYTYNLLINGCAKVGYCKKAFKLYTQMKKTGVKRTPATYTGLFNACALSPDPEDGLMRLNNLRKSLQDSGVTLSLINYNVMMKAYGRLKDLYSTFQVVDEMLSKGFSLKEETFCFLLQGCISDKESGMRHALLTWHKMRRKKVQPTLYAYNLLIRCIRDCDFGDEEEVREVIKQIVSDFSKSTILLDSGTLNQEDQKLLDSADATNVTNVPPSSQSEKPEFTYEEIEMVENRPNLLAKKPYLGSIISIREVKTPADRLLLLGGYKNLLKEMEEDGVKPDVKTFTQLLNVMPSTESAEKYLMNEMEKHNLFMDINFCNMLMKQRALRFDYEGAKQVLSIIQSKYLQPDIITFGVLAMSCRNRSEVIELIQSMKTFSMRLNAEILGTMVHGACARYNFNLVIFLMKLTQKYRISPNEQYMQHLEALEKQAIAIRKAIKRKKPLPAKIANDKDFREDSLVFSDYFAQWKKEVDVFKPPHPYKQFWKPKEKSDAVDESSRNLSREGSERSYKQFRRPKEKTDAVDQSSRNFSREGSERPTCLNSDNEDDHDDDRRSFRSSSHKTRINRNRNRSERRSSSDRTNERRPEKLPIA